jgi:hypothetical protein
LSALGSVGILLENRSSLTRIGDAARKNISLPVPFSDEAEKARTAIRYSKRPLVRKIASKVLKVGIGAAAGHYVGRYYGKRAGVATGAVAGLLFSDPGLRGTVRLAVDFSKNVTNL